MLLKYFLLNTLLVLSSVTAIPNPDTDNYDVEARDVNDDPAGHLVDRDDRYGSRCGTDATWDKKQKMCFCKKNGDFYDDEMKKCCPKGKKWNGRRCDYDCGKDADWDRRKNECVCKKKHAQFGFGKDKKQCKCRRDMWDDGYECRCKAKKFWDHRSQKCKPRRNDNDNDYDYD
ncbi:hypothetical protein B0T10DRAFT_549671 [Thelonectria olida]|uniref:Uncharacterized protein n=1 Tax=Thelonectria olida TaxID=1576542 RepID=A0A9P8W242_9HYPO|nr:hypothetical protein B0T10DRAFT_549671 [Thelonectria olida]